jgi:hypothetical protein
MNPEIMSLIAEIHHGPEECVLQYCKKQEEACVNDRRCIQSMD